MRIYRGDVDPVKVRRALAGWPVDLSEVEQHAVVRAGRCRGMSAAEIGEALRVTSRTVLRIQRRDLIAALVLERFGPLRDTAREYVRGAA